MLKKLVGKVLKAFLEVEELTEKSLGNPKKFLIVAQHLNFGELLAAHSIFRAIKNKYANSAINVVAGTNNYYAVYNNKFVIRNFTFSKRRLLNPYYLARFWSFLKRDYDVVIVPTAHKNSLTSSFISRLAEGKLRIGPNSLNGRINQYRFMFNYRIDLDWTKYPDAHISDFIMDIVRPFGLTQTRYSSKIYFDYADQKIAKNFLKKLKLKDDEYLIGFEVGAKQHEYRWSLIKIVHLIKKIKQNYKAKFYLIGSAKDKNERVYLKNNLEFSIPIFLSRKTPAVAALISKSDLFITNHTEEMFIAGTTETPQISVFGPTSPFKWAPVGSKKYFIKKSDLIDDISVDDVYQIVDLILGDKNQ
jgi:ADP-heptose:LPS heptosyltransferase